VAVNGTPKYPEAVARAGHRSALAGRPPSCNAVKARDFSHAVLGQRGWCVWAWLFRHPTAYPPRTCRRIPWEPVPEPRRFSEGTPEQDDTGDDTAPRPAHRLGRPALPAPRRRGHERRAAAATELGLATCLLSEPLEVGTTRLTLRDEVLDGKVSPQLMLRVGWAPAGDPLPPTPTCRRDARAAPPLVHEALRLQPSGLGAGVSARWQSGP